MANNPITTGKPKRGEMSPEDPQECCDWANARLEAAGDDDRRWFVTGNKDRPIELRRAKLWKPPTEKETND
jgi:hypothetical protein